MHTLKRIFPYLLLVIIAAVFYHKYFLFGLIPFPGDLLVAEYQPFRSYSYAGYIPGSIPNKAQYFDTIREFYPWQTFTTNEIKKGNLPLWNPHDFSGAPHLANFLTAVFYPLNLIYLGINQIDAWAILVLLQPLLASLFTYLYARKIGLNMIGSLFAGLAFAYSAYMNTWLQFQVIGHTLLWLPLILYSIESLTKKFSFKLYLLLVLSILCAIFAGHPLDLFAVMSFSLVYLFFRIKAIKLSWREGTIIGSSFLISFLLGSVQLIPSANLFINSTRSPMDYQFLIDKILISPFQLIMLLIPDYFGNPATRSYWPTNSYVGMTLSVGITSIIFVLLAFYNFSKIEKRKNYVTFFTLCAGFILILVTNNFFSINFYKLNIPILSTIQPNKLLPLFAFCLSLIAGIGMDFYSTSKKISTKKLLYTFSTLGLMFTLSIVGLIFVPLDSRNIAIKQIILSVGIASVGLVIFLGGLVKWKKYATFALLTLLLIEQFYAFQKFNPFSPREFIFPKAPLFTFLQENAGINRFWGYGTARIESNIASQYGLYSPDGFGALNLLWYNQFIKTSKDGHILESFDQETRSVAEIEPGYGETDLPNNIYRLKVLDTLGVKYILNRTENPTNAETFPTNRFKLVWQDEAGWQVYENLKSVPRFFLTNKVDTYSTVDEFEKKFFDKTFDPSTMVLVESAYQSSQFCSDEELRNTKLTLQEYEPASIVFTSETACPTFLFISDTFHPNWKATIDSIPKQIYRTNYALRGIEVPSGNHKIRFHYALL